MQLKGLSGLTEPNPCAKMTVLFQLAPLYEAAVKQKLLFHKKENIIIVIYLTFPLRSSNFWNKCY